jgi:hypothetical protein
LTLIDKTNYVLLKVIVFEQEPFNQQYVGFIISMEFSFLNNLECVTFKVTYYAFVNKDQSRWDFILNLIFIGKCMILECNEKTRYTTLSIKFKNHIKVH